MAFFEAVAAAFRNYFNFAGRANRRQFWYWLAFVVIMYLILLCVDLWVIAPLRGFAPNEQGAGTLLSMTWLVVCILPTITLVARRVHDNGHSAFWALAIVPLAWWLFAKGDKGENRFD